MQAIEILLVAFANLLFATNIFAQQCSLAPTFATQLHCDRLRQWDFRSRTTPPLVQPNAIQPPFPGSPPTIAPPLATVPATAYDCMNLGCLCSYFGGTGRDGTNACTLANGQPLQRAVRQEYRLLSDAERQRYHAAVNTLKRSGVFDQIAAIHSNVVAAGGAHGAPSFLPWHREFIKRYEIALRQVDPFVVLPYWDSTLESNLPNPADSALFTSTFLGASGPGGIVDGPFAGWRTRQGTALSRAVGQRARPHRESDIAFVMQQTRIEMVLGYTTPQAGCPFPASFNVLEFSHGETHNWVGGDMGPLTTAANDPVFYMHHAFVDFIWEMWRTSRQSPAQREQDYPADNPSCESPRGYSTAPMSPFNPMRNIDGCSNQYTNNLYQYGQRPSCALGPNCGSTYLYCVRARGVCVPKIRLGGNCQGFSIADDICLNGQCAGGICAQTNRADDDLIEPEGPQSYLPIPRTKDGRSVLRPIDLSCFNEHQCCTHWSSIGECNRNPGYMTSWCKPSCDLCEPNYDNVTDCADRHHKCAAWAAMGHCTRNRFWMEENCRLTCTNCYAHRAIVCGDQFAQSSPAAGAPMISQFMRADVDAEADFDAGSMEEHLLIAEVESSLDSK